ncbi:hypothetical protein DB31_7846 [Hyalangium minutum]|uniref:Uncharacterized protein n=1 Tax=Hyalangium minutum TaxID=394096 RepID=A0A085WLP6_9BACT|nr:hypothetical protein DB31_7846 [Hyalangium minutum]
MADKNDNTTQTGDTSGSGTTTSSAGGTSKGGEVPVVPG